MHFSPVCTSFLSRWAHSIAFLFCVLLCISVKTYGEEAFQNWRTISEKKIYKKTSFLLPTFFFFLRVSKERTQRLKVSKNKMTNKSVLSGLISHYLQFFLLTFCTSPSSLLLQLRFCLFFFFLCRNSQIHQYIFFLSLLLIRNLMFPSLLPIYSKINK